MSTIEVRLGTASVFIESGVFTALFDASVASSRAPYLHALETSQIKFTELVQLARTADIPYTLFFAPRETVDQQLKKKSEILLSGVSKDAFSLNSRSQVRLADVELIVKDILRKQEMLKRLDQSLTANKVVGCLRRSQARVEDDARFLSAALGFTSDDLKTARTKNMALELLISRFEARQIFVAQSQQNFMPQRLPQHAKFSGLCVRDKKIPFIFLTSGDLGENFEPEGRRVFTLVLLAVFVAHAKFAPVTYSDRSAEPITAREYEITEELLMPRSEVQDLSVSGLDDLRAHADTHRVTPSAFVMRARRLGLIDRVQAEEHLSELAREFAARTKRSARSPLLVNALRRYNGVEFSKRMLTQLDRGSISKGDFCRVVLQNKIKPEQIYQFREAL